MFPSNLRLLQIDVQTVCGEAYSSAPCQSLPDVYDSLVRQYDTASVWIACLQWPPAVHQHCFSCAGLLGGQCGQVHGHPEDHFSPQLCTSGLRSMLGARRAVHW